MQVWQFNWWGQWWAVAPRKKRLHSAAAAGHESLEVVCTVSSRAVDADAREAGAGASGTRAVVVRVLRATRAHGCASKRERPGVAKHGGGVTARAAHSGRALDTRGSARARWAERPRSGEVSARPARPWRCSAREGLECASRAERTRGLSSEREQSAGTAHRECRAPLARAATGAGDCRPPSGAVAS